MLQFQYVGFQQRIDQIVIQRCEDHSILIFPTERSAFEAKRLLQEEWNWREIEIFSMDQFKQVLLTTPFPILQEEKRLIALYTAMNQEVRDYFHVEHYFDFIKLGQTVLRFWGELHEEMVEEERVWDVIIESGLETQPWQEKTWSLLQTWKQEYGSYLQEHQLTDSMFIKVDMEALLARYAEYGHFHFVNQIYYTNSEKDIIQQLEGLGKDITVYYQIPRHCVEEATLSSRDFSFHDLVEMALPEAKIYWVSNEFGLSKAILHECTTQTPTHIIDFEPTRSPYYAQINHELFEVSASRSIAAFPIYQYLMLLYELWDSTMIEPERRIRLIPLDSLYRVIQHPLVAKQLGLESEKAILVVSEDLCRLTKEKVLYTDKEATPILQLNTFAKEDKRYHTDTIHAIHTIGSLLEQLSEVENFDQLLTLIDQEGGLSLQANLTEEERDSTNIAELVYASVANLKAIESIGLVDNWREMFGNGLDAISKGIYRLWLDYIKPKRVIQQVKKTDHTRIAISSLQDTRNLQVTLPMFLHVTEGVLPASRKTPFLFNEKQRQAVGLKTYEDIRLREKYYFYRLVLGAKKATFISVVNLDENQESSSFLDEMLIYAKQTNQNWPAVESKIVIEDSDYQEWIKKQYPVEHIKPDLSQLTERDFRIPCDIEEDFGSPAKMMLSYSSYYSLAENQIRWKMEQLSNFTALTIPEKPTLSASFLGDLVHTFFSVIWSRIIETAGQEIVRQPFQGISKDYLTVCWQHMIEKDSLLYYQNPHNYSSVYFERIVKKHIWDSLLIFFQTYLHEKCQLSGDTIRIMPEGKGYRRDELREALFIPAGYENIPLSIVLKGKADLRIEDLHTQKRYIIDYKTGKSAEPYQLLMYELFYYYNKEEYPPQELSPNVESAFYKVMESEWVSLEGLAKKGTNDLLSKLIGELVGISKQIAEEGYILPEKRAGLSLEQEITRGDLYLNLIRLKKGSDHVE